MKKTLIYIWAAIAILWGIFYSSTTITEFYYSNGIYPVLSRLFRLLFGWIPLSIGDVLYTLLGGWILYQLIRYGKDWIRKPLSLLWKVVSFVVSIVLFFYLNWGFNYYRTSLAEQLGISTEYNQEQLFAVTEYYLKETNCLQEELAGDSEKMVEIPINSSSVLELSEKAYQNLSAFYPQWDYAYPSVKKSLYSEVLSYMGYSGYLNPFTNEAQINSKIVPYQQPLTACHEIAHQLGYAAEQEANFIGYLACSYSPNRYFNYSASLFAFRYCLAEVRKVDAERYDFYLQKINAGVLKSYQKSNDFWKSYENPLEPQLKKGYDAYLKANQQSSGIESYNQVVGLLIGNAYKNSYYQ